MVKFTLYEVSGLNYDETIKSFYDKIGEAKKFVLATSKDNQPTARMMSCIIIDNVFCIQTDRFFTKYNQMIANPKVAICNDNIQIEGIAQENGHPLDKKNELFAKMFEKYYPSSFQMYTHLKNETVFQIIPTKITLWEYENGKPFRILLDCVNQTVVRENYEV